MPTLRWHRPWPPALAVRGSSGIWVCPAPLARPCPSALPVRAPQVPGSAQLPWPGPALPSCPACVRAPQAPGSAQLPWPGPVLLPCLCAGSSGAQVCPAPLARPFCPACAGSSGARVCPAPLAGPAPTGPLPPLWNALAFLPQSVRRPAVQLLFLERRSLLSTLACRLPVLSCYLVSFSLSSPVKPRCAPPLTI